PIETALGRFRVDRHAEGAGDRERHAAMLLGLCSGGTMWRGRADFLEHCAGETVREARHKAIQRALERGGRYRRQDHSPADPVEVATMDYLSGSSAYFTHGPGTATIPCGMGERQR